MLKCFGGIVSIDASYGDQETQRVLSALMSASSSWLGTCQLLKLKAQMPVVMIMDKLRFYGAMKMEIMPDVEHCQHKGLNNRAEN